MDEQQVMRDTGDAIVLERAARVLERRHPQSVRAPAFSTLRDRERIRTAIYTLKTEAQQLRGESRSI